MKITDQIGNELTLKQAPKRIVCLVPSITEFLFDIGLKENIIGITKFCIHPKLLVIDVVKVGGTKKINFQKIKLLEPDLIVANKEENTKDEILELQKQFNVYVSDILSLEDCYNMMLDIGALTNRKKQSALIIQTLRNDFNALKKIGNKKTVAYFIWKNPFMLAGNESFINTILNQLGFVNSLQQLSRYPEVNEETLKELNPDFCFLSSEPYPFKQKDINELKELLPKSKIILVDGELFSWYGSRLLQLKTYCKELQKDLKLIS